MKLMEEALKCLVDLGSGSGVQMALIVVTGLCPYRIS